jgi:hypothetical protein
MFLSARSSIDSFNRHVLPGFAAEPKGKPPSFIPALGVMHHGAVT